MTNPNLISVWSPDGSEMIETSRANARDLVNHVGWTYSPPHVIEKIIVVEKAPEPEKEPANEVGETETETPAETEAEEVTETPAEDAGDDEAGEEEAGEEEADALENTPTVRKTEEDFADLESREDVVAYLAATFPDFKPHHLSKRDGLVAKAIELANA